MTDTLPTHNFIIQCHLTQGKIDDSQPIRLVMRDEDQLSQISAEQATAMLSSLLINFNHENNLIFVEDDDIQAALSIDGAVWIASMVGLGSEKGKSACLDCLSHPALSNFEMCDYLLASICSSDALGMDDFEQVSDQLDQYINEDTPLKIALHFDDHLGDDVIVSLIATGCVSSAKS